MIIMGTNVTPNFRQMRRSTDKPNTKKINPPHVKPLAPGFYPTFLSEETAWEYFSNPSVEVDTFVKWFDGHTWFSKDKSCELFVQHWYWFPLK